MTLMLSVGLKNNENERRYLAKVVDWMLDGEHQRELRQGPF